MATSRTTRDDGPRRWTRRGSAAVKALAIGLAAAVLIAIVVVLVQEGGGGADFSALRGRWLRPDGGYVLEIRGVAPDGKLEAAYFNPQPIRVSRAEATRDGKQTKVFVELNDTGYPGCTYTLVHEAQKDLLTGEYFQAAQGARYDIYFERTE